MLKKAIGVLALLVLAAGMTALPAWAGGMAGMDGMGNMPMGPMNGSSAGAGKALSYAAVKPLLKASNSGGMVMGHGKHKSVMFMGRHVHIVMIAVEPGSPDTTFEIHKLVDPEITVPAGAKVTITLVNMDYGPGMVHGVAIGKVRPPYKMVVPVPVPGQLAIIPLLMPRTAKSITQAKYSAGSATFTAPKAPGTYHYLCQMPGHAKSGMYGEFVVQR